MPNDLRTCCSLSLSNRLSLSRRSSMPAGKLTGTPMSRTSAMATMPSNTWADTFTKAPSVIHASKTLTTLTLPSLSKTGKRRKPNVFASPVKTFCCVTLLTYYPQNSTVYATTASCIRGQKPLSTQNHRMDMATYTKSCLSYPPATTQHKDLANERLFAQSTYAYRQNTHEPTAVEPFLAHHGMQSQGHCSANIHSIDTNKTSVTRVIDTQAILSLIENA